MALIKCPECGEEISEHAYTCIHCGYPLKEMIETGEIEIKRKTYDINVYNVYPLKIIRDKATRTEKDVERAEACLDAEKWLLKELLGYSEEESGDIANADTWIIAKSVDTIQLDKIYGAFTANGVRCFVYDHDTREQISMEKFKGYTGVYEEKKEHYCDSPIISPLQKGDSDYDAMWNKKSAVMKTEKDVLKKEPDIHIPKCPTCGSTNVKKLGVAERGVTTWAVGMASKKINKSFKCNNCGYTW